MGNSVLALLSNFRRVVVVVSLLFIYIFGANALYGLLYRNGYYDALLRLWSEGPHHLPGSSNDILVHFTGIGFLDKLLTLAGVMFANVTDGSSPQLSLYAFHFGGQYLAILVVIAIEGLRSGNQSNPLRFFSFWGCLMQAASYGCTMPLYALIHLTTSFAAEEVGPSLLDAVQTTNLRELSVLPQSFIVGYVIPTILMSIPLFTNPVHQWFGGLWQGSPLWAMLIQKLLASKPKRQPQSRGLQNHRRISQTSSKESFSRCSQSPASSAREEERSVLAKVYLFAFIWCVLSQIIPLILIAAVRLRPSAFPPHLYETWTVSKVFMPPPFWSTKKMESMATGMHDFFLYDQYVGSTAAIVWSTALYINSREMPMRMKSWAKLAFVIAALSVSTGPAGAVVGLMWERDRYLLSMPRKGF